MNSYYRTSLDKIRLDPDFGTALDALERGFKKFQIDYYLVGAVSRNVWLNGINGISPRRTTGDVDFAVFINDKGIYHQLKEYLVTTEGFLPYRENGFVLIWKDNTEIDLLPFGAIEDENRKVTIEGPGYTSVQVDGFKEVYEQQLPEIELDSSHRFKCCTLPGIVLLKLIAWDDRPEARRDDIKDIAEILDHFFDMNNEMIWTEYSDLFAVTPAFDDGREGLLLIASYVLGKEIKKITGDQTPLYARLKEIISKNAIDPFSSKMAQLMASHFDNSAEDVFHLIREIEKGFTE